MMLTRPTVGADTARGGCIMMIAGTLSFASPQKYVRAAQPVGTIALVGPLVTKLIAIAEFF